MAFPQFQSHRRRAVGGRDCRRSSRRCRRGRNWEHCRLCRRPEKIWTPERPGAEGGWTKPCRAPRLRSKASEHRPGFEGLNPSPQRGGTGSVGRAFVSPIHWISPRKNSQEREAPLLGSTVRQAFISVKESVRGGIVMGGGNQWQPLSALLTGATGTRATALLATRVFGAEPAPRSRAPA